jgi:hypothetical protein
MICVAEGVSVGRGVGVNVGLGIGVEVYVRVGVMVINDFGESVSEELIISGVERVSVTQATKINRSKNKMIIRFIKVPQVSDI